MLDRGRDRHGQLRDLGPALPARNFSSNGVVVAVKTDADTRP